jgi:single-strand DNA-binding protein
MSKSVNKVILVGNLTRDPEMRYTPSQLAIANMSIATNESRKDKESGEWRDYPEYHNITFFGKLAEIAEKWLKSGSKIYVEGSLRTEKWEDKDSGKTMKSTKIIGSELLMLGGKQESANESNSSSTKASDSEYPFPEDDSVQGLTDDEIPF